MHELARFGLILVVVAAPVAVMVTAAGGCKIEFGCADDACTSSAIAGSSSSGGECIVPTPAGTDTHGFPPAVDAVLKKNCRSCHSTPLQNNAPQPWDSYEDTQEHRYCPEGQACDPAGPNTCGFGACGASQTCSCEGVERWWAWIRKAAVERDDPNPASGATPMPSELPPIPQCEQDILSAWLATCGADTDANLCERFEPSTSTTSSSSTGM